MKKTWCAEGFGKLLQVNRQKVDSMWVDCCNHGTVCASRDGDAQCQGHDEGLEYLETLLVLVDSGVEALLCRGVAGHVVRRVDVELHSTRLEDLDNSAHGHPHQRHKAEC